MVRDFLTFGYRLLFLSSVLSTFMVVSAEPHLQDALGALLIMWSSLIFAKVLIRRNVSLVLILTGVVMFTGLMAAMWMLQIYFLLLGMFLVLLYRMNLFFHEESTATISTWYTIKYIFHFIPLIFHSCWETAMCIWGRRGKINPFVLWVNLPDLEHKANNQARNLITAHSITLTPGTLVLDMRNNSIFVHALNTWSWRSLQDNNWHENIRLIFVKHK